MSNTNETIFEQVGDQKVRFENINGDWRVGTREIHRVFKGHTATNHGAMVNDMKRMHGDNWDRYIDLMNIHKVSEKDSGGRTYNSYLFDRTAFTYFCLSFTGKATNEYKFHFIDTLFELEKDN